MSVRLCKWKTKEGKVQEAWWVDVKSQHPNGKVKRVRKASPINTRRALRRYERQVRHALLTGTFGKEKQNELGRAPTLREFVPRFITYSENNNQHSSVVTKRQILDDRPPRARLREHGPGRHRPCTVRGLQGRHAQKAVRSTRTEGRPHGRQWSDVDLQRGKLHVRRTIWRGVTGSPRAGASGRWTCRPRWWTHSRSTGTCAGPTCSASRTASRSPMA